LLTVILLIVDCKKGFKDFRYLYNKNTKEKRGRVTYHANMVIPHGEPILNDHGNKQSCYQQAALVNFRIVKKFDNKLHNNGLSNSHT